MSDGKKTPDRTGRDLGEDRAIPRRDILQGMVIGAGSLLTGSLLKPPAALAALGTDVPAQDLPGYYPPRRLGMRGSHPGAFEAAHGLRDGAGINAPTDTGETYDLVVVGGGISGLSAAHFYRQQHPGARVLILDNHDDFGGHAKRNELQIRGRLMLINGGTLEIDSPRPYSTVAKGVLSDLGIDTEKLQATTAREEFYEGKGLSSSIFFDKETFGADFLAVRHAARLKHGQPTADHLELGDTKHSWGTLLARSPLSPKARADLARLYEGPHEDVLPGLSSDEKKDRLSRLSYFQYLRDYIKVDPQVLAYAQALTHAEWGVGIDAVPAIDCWGFAMPGFEGLKLDKGVIKRMGPTAAGYYETGGSEHYHFPDGNASIVRLMVRKLIPGAISGSSVIDVVTAQADYSKLDQASNEVRIRLNSTVLNVRHGDSGVETIYVRAGQPLRVRSKHAVMACWNAMIPYLVPDLPAEQKAALHQQVKCPLVYTNVAIRNWHAFMKLGFNQVYSPGCYHTSFGLNPNVQIGGYHAPTDPSQPILVRMTKTPCLPGLDEFAQNRAGRAELLATPFSTFERNIREQLGRTLGPGGFDPARDIEAIIVNRWPHGYSAEYNPLYDPDVPEGQESWVIGRKAFGSITIANSDAGNQAYTDSAINQAWRAVSELPA